MTPKIDGKKKFLYSQSRYLSYPLKRMLYNTLIQPNYDFACCSWYPNLSVSLKTKLQKTQNSQIRYCFGLKDRIHVGKNEFRKINRLPISSRVDQCLAVTAYTFKKALSAKYIGDIYSLQISPNIRTCRSIDDFVVPFYKKAINFLFRI